MTHTIFLELDFYRTGYRSVKAHQYDKDTRFIEVTCIKDASAYPLNPNTMTCILKLQTPDGRHMLKTQTIQPDGKILIALEESMLLAAGTCRAELNVYELSTKKLLSTMPFDLIVIGSVYDNSIVEDSDKFSLLNDMIFFNKELGDKLEQLETDITDAESKRAESEEIRKENETSRQQNEAAREAKESAREAAEAIRTANEETRKSNEIDRQNAEKARSDTFDQLQDNVDAELTKIEQVNISPLPGKNSYQIQVTDRNGLISASPNLLHTLQMGTVETGDSDEDPTASITGDFGNQKLNLRLPTGKPFKIQRTYTSISEMNADTDNIELYEFVLIHTGSVEDEDTGKLYMKDVSGMSYLTDLSGVQGIQGVKGETGATPNLSIGSVTTGEPGTEASVQISGTKENPLLHLTIPRGEPGTIEDLSPEDIGALPVLTSSPSYNTFEDFWSDANKHGIKTSSHMCAMRFKDTGGWTPSLGWWCAIVGFQNGIGSQWSVTGRILLMSTGLAQGGQHVYYGLVDGGSTTTPEVSVTWYKVYSEIDKPSPTDIGALPLTGGTVNGIIKSDKLRNTEYSKWCSGWGVYISATTRPTITRTIVSR
jgi:hypothetical protein